MRILLVRHGESLANVDRSVYLSTADHAVPLSDRRSRTSISRTSPTGSGRSSGIFCARGSSRSGSRSTRKISPRMSVWCKGTTTSTRPGS